MLGGNPKAAELRACKEETGQKNASTLQVRNAPHGKTGVGDTKALLNDVRDHALLGQTGPVRQLSFTFLGRSVHTHRRA